MRVTLGLLPEGGLVNADELDEVARLASVAYVHHGSVVVLPAAGAFLLATDDIVVPVGGEELKLTRTYSSFRPDADGNAKVGVLGPGWQHSFETSGVDRKEDSSRRFDAKGRLVAMAIGGLTVGLTYEKGRLVSMGCGEAILAAFGYDDAGRLARVDGPDKVGTSFAYDGAGRLTREERAGGGKVDYEYDSAGRLVRVSGSGSPTYGFSYDQYGRASTVSGPGALSTTIAYGNRAPGIVTVTDAGGHTTRFQTEEGGRQVTVVDPAGGHTVKQFDSAGRLVHYRNPTGQVTGFSYDANGNTLSISYADGRAKRFSYDASGRLERVQLGALEARLEYGSDGHLLRFVDERGRATIYEWDGSLIRKVSSPNGRTTTYEYDDLGRVTSLTDEDGRVETRAYDAAGRLTKLTGPDGRADVVEYDPEGRVVARTDLYGGGGRWEYDAMGRVTRMVDALGGGTEFLYDESGLLTLVRKEDGLRAVALEYDSTGRLVAQSGTLGTARYEYDAAGRVTKTTDMNGGVLQRGYDAAGRVAWISRNGLQVYAAGYDGMGRLVKERGPQGPERVYTYNDAGRLVTISEGDGKTSLTYDSYGDITGIQRTGDLGGRPSVEKLRRDGDGRVVEETAIPGGTTTYVWDRRGRLAEMTTPDKRRTQWTYDEADRPAKVAVVGGETIDFTYGAGGLLKTKKSSAGWREDYDYDLLGRRTQWTDAAGVRRTYGYGSGGRLEKVTLWTSEWRYKYDLGGRLTGVIDPRGGSRAFSYVSGENPSTRIDANGRATLWSYAPNGFPAQVTLEDGAVARFTYDRAGNLQEWKVKDVVVSRRTRDSRGRVVEDVGSGHSLAWGYGPDGRLLRVKDEQANISLTYTHDGNGNLASHRLHDGTTLKYERDDLGRVLGVTGPGDASVKVSYDGLGQMKEVRLGAGLNVRYSYDLRGLVTKIEATSGGTPVLSVTRAYDAAGRITSSTQDGKTYKYRYDGDGRLAEVTRPDQSVEGYGYDRAGDLVSAGATRLTRNAGGQVTASAQPDAIYTWSKRGGLIGRNGGDAQVSLAYDAAGQLATITTGSGTQVSYGYAPDGSLLWRKDAAGETRFINDRGDVVAEIEGGTVRRVYLNGDTLDRRFGVVDGGLTRYYITDADNSVLAVVDAAGTILNRYYYDPFGQTKVDKEGVANPYRFKGRYRDAGTGLVHFRNRWYSPALRSFVQPDPVEGDLLRPETMNLYAFLENDPLNRHDPAGLKPIQWPSSIPSVIKTGADALENACKGFQSGQINGTYVSGKALDGFKCLGGIEKNGWAYDVWTKQLPNGMQNIHFRELGYKTGSGYNNMAISGNINLDTTNSKYFGQWGPSLRERLANAGEAVQKYWKDVAATVASLGGMSGTLKSSVGLIASLPGGAAIIGAAAAVAGALGYAVGTGLNSFDCVQNGAQGIISSALGYDTDQDIANTKAELENEGTVMKWKDAVNISRNLTEWGPGALTPPGGKLADGTAPLDMPPPPAGGGGVVVPPIGPFGPPLPPPRVPAEGAPPPGTNVQPPPKLTEAEAMTAVDVLTEAGIVPTRVTATGRLDVGKLISCDITVYFWNVGAYFEEEGTIYRDVKVTTICHGDAQGANQTKQGMGTFSGGPNGVFTLHSDAGGGSVQLVGGRKIVGKGNVVLTVQNPGAFDNWPESIK
jgi:RHS repeat-associated protein